MSEPHDDAEPASLRIERILPSPPEEVFRAWTDPVSMGRWLSPVGHAEVSADVRPGGRLRVVMVGDDMHIEHEGEYQIVEPPTRLRFTWASPYTGPEPSVVTVELTPVEAGTRLVLVHERLPRETAASHRDGWGAILGRLEAELVHVDDREEEPTG